MSDTPPYAELLSLIDDRSAVLRDAAAGASDFQARVPGCPEWGFGDLVAHVGGVQRFWAAVVRDANAEARPSSLSDLDPPADDADLPEWFAESTRLLLAALTEAGPDAPSWAWWGASGAPLTAEAVARHQVQEAAVHAHDAQETIGKPEPLPAAIAVDGVAEFLSVGMSSLGEWPHRPARVAFTATEGPTWTVDLSPSGVTVNPAASGEPITTVHAPAADLVLALYGRLDFADLRVDGDREVLTEIRTWSNPG
jgi:uncharacterized protein (TIGR03083 family)